MTPRSHRQRGYRRYETPEDWATAIVSRYSGDRQSIERRGSYAMLKDLWALERAIPRIQDRVAALENTVLIRSLEAEHRALLEDYEKTTPWLQRAVTFGLPQPLRSKLFALTTEIQRLSTIASPVKSDDPTRLLVALQDLLHRISDTLPVIREAVDQAHQRAAARDAAAKMREAEHFAKERVVKAAAAAYLSRSRSAAAEVKARIREQLTLYPLCPYCGADLGPRPHADHIQPISLGGLSTDENMAFACEQCNLRKAGRTLREFAKHYQLDRDRIERALEVLGKRF